MGFLSGSKQYNINQSGLVGPERANLSQYAGGQLPSILGGLQTTANQPFQFQYTKQLFPELNNQGLFTEQANALQAPFQNAVAQMFSNVSGAGSLRGFNNPENIGAIAGSAAQNVAPQFASLFANLAGQNVANRLQFNTYQNQGLPLELQQQQEAIRQNRVAQLLSGYSQVPGFLGSTSSGGATGPGFGYAAGGSLFGGVGQGIGADGTAAAIA